MRPLGRNQVNKRSSSKKFAHSTAKTKAANVQPRPMRGGFRL
ncbi:MAG: hypothetical protein [Microvirus sp.]|nr:MAG: hypothetical protein [Microvirus sp.]